jgi:hypothetical protein
MSRFLGGVGSSQLRASRPLAFHGAGWFHCQVVIGSLFIQRFLSSIVLFAICEVKTFGQNTV